jgi:hypothetical protein
MKNNLSQITDQMEMQSLSQSDRTTKNNPM